MRNIFQKTRLIISKFFSIIKKFFNLFFRSIHTRNCCIATGVFGCIFLILGVVVMLAGGPMLEVNIYKNILKNYLKSMMMISRIFSSFMSEKNPQVYGSI